MASTVSDTKPRPVKRKRSPDGLTVEKSARLFAARAAWMPAHWRRSGGPCWLVTGDSGNHHTDLLACTCLRRQFMPTGPEQACSHIRAVRRWYAEARAGLIPRHPRGPHVALTDADWDAFTAQDLVLAEIADSLLVQYELRSRMSVAQRDRHDGRPSWMEPGDRWDGAEITAETPPPARHPDDLANQLAREEAETRRLRRRALVAPDADPESAPPDEGP